MGPVSAVVVTYNRCELLAECLEALLAQERAPDRVLVIDNASTDGTPAMVRKRFPRAELRTLSVNEGGAGGFHEGLKTAYAAGAEWMWVMDDDTIPRRDALARLIDAAGRLSRDGARPLLLASQVVWSDGSTHPMNVPGRRGHPPEGGRGLVPLRYASFVSLMLHRDAVARHGLPLKHYFIWSDDIEYTARILRREHAGYLVEDSVVLHKTEKRYTAASGTGERFYFHIRNHVFMLRSASWDRREKLVLIYKMVRTSIGYLRANGWRRRDARTIGRALRDGIGRVPVVP